MYFYLKFKLRYLENLKLFSIIVKELFEPLVLRGKKRRVFVLFKRHFLEKPTFFLRNRPLSQVLVTLGDFTVK